MHRPHDGAAGQPADAALSIPPFAATQVSLAQIDGQSFGLSFADRSVGAIPAATLYANPGYATGSLSTANLTAPVERELGHALGITAFRFNVLSTANLFNRTLCDLSIDFVQQGPVFQTTFNGPNAQAAYGGPVPVAKDNPAVTLVANGQAAGTPIEGTSTIQPFDVALLRDAGLPALSDQELGEHQVARLYVAAFGRNADSAGLIQQYAAMRSGESLAQLGDGLVGSAEFSSRYGGLSDAA